MPSPAKSARRATANVVIANPERSGGGRGPRPERNATPQAEARTEELALDSTAPQAAGGRPAGAEAPAAAEGEREGGRRRRRRGGRDRGEGRSDEGPITENGESPAPAKAPMQSLLTAVDGETPAAGTGR